MKQEKFAFRANVKRISHIGSLLDRPFQDIARIALKWRAVRPVNITNQAGHFAKLRAPWEDHEGIVIRAKIHIRLLNADKAFNRRAVKHAFIIERLLQLANSNRHIFQLAKNIRKLKADKLHVFFLCNAEDIFFRILSHDNAPFLKK